MKKLSFKQAEKLHREKWECLAESGSDDICDWPREELVEDFVNRCSACEIASNGMSGLDCLRCPIEWDNEFNCYDDRSYFQKWANAKTPETRKKYATIIRDLPWVKR
jgi:hypothetical protein